MPASATARRVALAIAAIAVLAVLAKLGLDRRGGSSGMNEDGAARPAASEGSSRRGAPALPDEGAGAGREMPAGRDTPPVPDVAPPHATDEPILPPEEGPLPRSAWSERPDAGAE